MNAPGLAAILEIILRNIGQFLINLIKTLLLTVVWYSVTQDFTVGVTRSPNLCSCDLISLCRSFAFSNARALLISHTYFWIDP